MLIVAYEAETHIRGVLERLPRALLADSGCRVLVIDDSSSDTTSDVAARWAAERPALDVVVLKGAFNLGYGGNQKLGYRYAIDEGFDRVVMVHGDGQYPPEAIPELLARLDAEGADVALGTRMHSLRSARRGGMPLYKIVGNRLLTIFQNRVTGRRLSEYHTGFRAYTTRFLRSTAFELNTNSFHFDTEILLQAFHAGVGIAEIPIPTHYGDEVCRVDGLRYAWNVVKATLTYASHRRGFACSLKYRRSAGESYADKTRQRGSTHAEALALVAKIKPATLLDIGSGEGYVSAACAAAGAAVTQVDVTPPTVPAGRFFRCDLERDELPVCLFDFDVVLMLDVVEHLAAPERLLLDLRNRGGSAEGAKATRVIVSTPNVAFLPLRLSHLLGRFQYAERGILDVTHKRLFTKKTLLAMLRDCSFEVEAIVPIGAPAELVLPGRLGAFCARLSSLLARLWPSGFAFQFLVVTRPAPGVAALLARARSVRAAS